MSTPESTIPSSHGPVAAGTMANEISAARFAAALVAVGAMVSALVLLTRTTIDVEGATSRPYVGQAIAVVALGIGLVATLLFLAAWAEAWREAGSTAKRDH